MRYISKGIHMLVHYLLGTSQDWSDQKVDGSITDLLCPLCHEQLSVVDTHDRGMARAKLRCPNGHEVVTSITQLQQPSSGAVLIITQERDSKKAKPRLPL